MYYWCLFIVALFMWIGATFNLINDHYDRKKWRGK